MDDVLDTLSLGQTDLEVSEIVFGTWRFGRETETGRVEIERSEAHELLDVAQITVW